MNGEWKWVPCINQLPKAIIIISLRGSPALISRSGCPEPLAHLPFQVQAMNVTSRFEEEIKAEQEEKKRQAEEMKQRKAAFKELQSAFKQ